MFNGLGARLELLEPFVDEFNGGVEVIRVDMPGAGESTTPVLPYRPPGLARLIVMMLDQLGYGAVDVLGVSLGGLIAQQFAHLYPDRCRRLILVSTGTGTIMVPGSPLVIARMLAPHRYDDSGDSEADASMYGGRVRENPSLMKTHGHNLQGGTLAGYYSQLLSVAGWTSILWLHTIQQRTLILSGTEDPIVPLTNARILSWLIRDSRLHVFDDGHLGLITSADTLAPIVAEFLAEPD
jgi:poly(3-hydroxyalkanoate) depolymerase